MLLESIHYQPHQKEYWLINISTTTHNPTLFRYYFSDNCNNINDIFLSRLVEEASDEAKMNLRFTVILMFLTIPAGFSLQSYFGMQKSSTMDGSNTTGSFKVDDPASFVPPKIEITGLEAKRAPPPRPHKLKPRDMNVLTPSGF